MIAANKSRGKSKPRRRSSSAAPRRRKKSNGGLSGAIKKSMYAAGYGVIRDTGLAYLTPYVPASLSGIGGAHNADELVAFGADYLLAKNTSGDIRQVFVSGMIVEAYRLGRNLSSQFQGGPAVSGIKYV